jgi:enolase
VGDDLFVTNVMFMRRATKPDGQLHLVKVNQFGSLTEPSTLSSWPRRKATPAFRTARANPRTVVCRIASPRFAARSRPPLSRFRRIAKYNQLLRFEDMLGDTAVYGGMM